MAGILAAGRDAAPPRLPHHAPPRRSARLRAAAAGACRSRSRCGRYLSCSCCRCSALLLTSLVPAVGVALSGDGDAGQLRFVLFEHAAARRAFVNSFGLSAAPRRRDRADRRAARLFPRAGAGIAAAARHQPRRRSAVCAAGRGAGDRGDPAVPEAAAAARRLALQHDLDHPLLLSRALPGARPAAGGQRLSPARPRRWRKRRRSPARGCCAGCARSSCRWWRRRRPRARC